MMRDLVRRAWRTFVTDLRDEVDAEMMQHRSTTPPGLVSRRIAIVVFGAAVGLLFVRFAARDGGEIDWAVDGLRGLGLGAAAKKLEWAMLKSPDKRIYQRVWWAAGRLIGYGLIPLLVTKLLLKDSVTQLGFLVKGTRKHLPLYVGMFLVVAPLVVVASYGPGFQAKYPYYRLGPGESLWPKLFMWEALYASQFVALEFFFRGFIVNGLRQSMGYAAVFMPIMPYTMIHYGKPLPEALGSVITGFVLGTMALKTRSIWGGAAIHISIACSMDFLSLWQQGKLF
jgi:membrane protease YdiL (CAAX protease family)